MDPVGYQVLVIDDQIAHPGVHQESFLVKVGRPKGDFAFCSGQSDDGRNCKEIVLDAVSRLWGPDRTPKLSLVLLDIRFDDSSEKDAGASFGLDLLRELRGQFGRALPIVMLTSVKAARSEANAASADGFLPKDELSRETLEAQLRRNGLYAETGLGLEGNAHLFLVALREVRRAVLGGLEELLILGETGSGKSEIAKYLHAIKGHVGPPVKWVARRSNIELHFDQLFGHWAGAHDEAPSHCAGAAERAHDGTLFIDEVAELSPDTQTDLLEYRQRGADGLRRIRRLGNAPEAVRRGQTRGLDLHGTYSAAEDRVLVRSTLVTATNAPIDDPVWRKNEGFREDLFNRMGHRIYLPALRDRAEDIVPLFMKFAQRCAGRHLTLAHGSERLLLAHQWREGNIAELDRVASVAVSRLGPDFFEIHPHHLTGALRESADDGPEASHPKPDSEEMVQGLASDFVGLELRLQAALAESLRSAVVSTRRPTGLASLQDILLQATGIAYSPTDVKRELLSVLAPWFEPNARQRRRWGTHSTYSRMQESIGKDVVLRPLYRYATGKVGWNVARREITDALQPGRPKA